MSEAFVLVLSVGALVPLLALSAFFSSSETAIFSLPEERANVTGDRETALRDLRADPHRLLVTLLVGNNLVNIAITSIVTVVVATFVSPALAVVLTTVIATTLVLVFGEIVPKSYGLGRAQDWSLRVAGPLTVVETVLWPVVFVFEGVTRRISTAIGGATDIEEAYLDDR